MRAFENLITVNYKFVSLTELLAMDKAAIKVIEAYNCPSLTRLDLPAATRIALARCPALTQIAAPVATRVEVSDCPSLPQLDVPAATTVYAVYCPALSQLNLPAAAWVEAGSCAALTRLDLPAAKNVYVSDCPALKHLHAPIVARIYVYDCPALGDAIYAGDGTSGYSFFGFRRRGEWRVYTAGDNYSLGEARAHWGPAGADPRPDCFALVEVIAAEAARRDRSGEAGEIA